MDQLLRPASILTDVEPSIVLTSAKHYEAAKDVLLGIGLKPIPSKGCPLVVHVNSEDGLESAFRELIWADPLIIRVSAGNNSRTCTLGSEIKDTWSYTVVSRFHGSPELPQAAARHVADIISGRVSLQIHEFEYFTLAQHGVFMHGGPGLGGFPDRPFAVIESQQYGWMPAFPKMAKENLGSELGWEVFRELPRTEAEHPLADLLRSTLRNGSGRIVENNRLRAELRPGLTLLDYRLECHPHLNLAWEPIDA